MQGDGVKTGPGLYRLLLAFAVVIHHTTRLSVGPTAVYLFFILSGYWIAATWSGKYAKQPNAYLNFIKGRFVRLLPLFILANIMVIGVRHQVTGLDLAPVLQQMSPWDAASAIWSNIFILGFNWQPIKVLGVAWSLDVEMQFYFIAPFMIWMARHLGAMGMAPLVALAALTFQDIGVHDTVCNYALFFYMGVLSRQLNWQPSLKWAQASAYTALALMATALFSQNGHEWVLGGAHATEHFHFNNLIFSIALAMTLFPLTIWVTQKEAGSTDKALGDLSYSLYLFHGPLQVLYVDWCGTLTLRERWPYLLLYLLATSVVSFLAWRLVDKQIIDYRSSKTRKKTKLQPRHDLLDDDEYASANI